MAEDDEELEGLDLGAGDGGGDAGGGGDKGAGKSVRLAVEDGKGGARRAGGAALGSAWGRLMLRGRRQQLMLMQGPGLGLTAAVHGGGHTIAHTPCSPQRPQTTTRAPGASPRRGR